MVTSLGNQHRWCSVNLCIFIQDNMTLTVAADANFGLVHKINSGAGIGVGRHLRFFLADQSVSDFMLKYDDRKGSTDQVIFIA